MKLQRLRIEQFKQFRQPLELAGLEPGLNLFTGPNESGKSTIVRAIRAAFFERYRSSSVRDLQPWGDGSASPSVELEFESGGRSWRLHKQFLQRKRCRLQVDAQALENDEAEQRLCELLGFQLAARGESKPEHWGIPGLLWIEQGGSHHIRDEVLHATDHLRTALQGSLGEVASTAGDDVLARVRAERNALLTEKKGEPRGDYAEAIALRDRLQVELQETQQRLAQYREQVDRLGQVQAEIALDEAERPWEPFEARRAEAQQQLDGLQAAAEQLQRQREQLAPLQRQIDLLQQQIEAHAQQQRSLAQREAALAAALQAQELAAQRLAPARQRAQEALQAQQAAQALLERVRARQWRESLQREHAAATQRVRGLEGALAEAQSHGAELARLREEAQRQALDAVQLKELRTLEQRLRELELRREAAATQLRWRFDAGAAPRLDGEPLEGQGERLLLQPALLELPGLGRLTVTPGGADLERLAAQLAEAQAGLEALRRRLSVASLAEAEARHERQRVLAGQIDTRQALLAQLAPHGVPALQAERDELQARLGALQAQLAALPPAQEGDDALPPPAQAEQGVKGAARLWEQAQQAAQQAQSALEQAQAAAEHARREHEALPAAGWPSTLTGLRRACRHAAGRPTLHQVAGLPAPQVGGGRLASPEAPGPAVRPVDARELQRRGGRGLHRRRGAFSVRSARAKRRQRPDSKSPPNAPHWAPFRIVWVKQTGALLAPASLAAQALSEVREVIPASRCGGASKPARPAGRRRPSQLSQAAQQPEHFSTGAPAAALGRR